MPKLRGPLLSLGATGGLTKLFSLARRMGQNIIERKPVPVDAKSPAQLFNRHMFSKCVDLWHLLSEPEQQEWESLARPRHMTGYAWYISQCLRPNPGIYLPLQGGTMQGIIEMAGYKIGSLLDPVAVQDADTKGARDAAIAAAIGGSLHCDIYGWHTDTWYKLMVESPIAHNLRVRLYAEGTAIATDTNTSDLPQTNMGLLVHAGLRVKVGVNWSMLWGRYASLDAETNTVVAVIALSRLYAYNGATWDRLRSWPTGTLKVGRAEIGLSTLRRVGAGQVKASPGSLYWMVLNPSAGSSLFELTDDLNGLGAIVLDHFDTTRDGHMMTFDPPMEFSTGIYLKTLTNITSITFGYK